jgi:hypothetical protein
MLRSQKEGLLRILNDDNNKEAVEAFHLEGIITLIDEIQDQAVDKHGIPEKEVFHLNESEIIPAVHQDEARELREIELREQIMSIFGAYQHFLYYFDQAKYEKDKVHEGMTSHFLDKLAYYRHIHSPEGYNSIVVLVTWVQNMTKGYQETLLAWIISNHSNKW